ncbi:MAG TPA: hypothetical protein VM118_01200 [Acidobacteriota bacterium]|nr:hypothetical protein [Acidobacteriota bacterium]
MRATLSDIRALPGVTGIAVLSKRDGRIEHLFPAAFTDRHTERLLQLVTETYKRLRGFSRLILRFERVIVHLFNQPDYLMFVTVLPETDMRQFETVIRSKFAKIAHTLAQTQAAPEGRRLPTKTTVPPGDPVVVLIDILNTVSARLGTTRGMARVAVDWRRARDTVAEQYQVLTALAVDPSGSLSIRKGRSLEPNAETIEAFVRLAEEFFVLIETARPDAEENFHSLIERSRALLEPYGVLLFLNQRARRRVVRR